jgi:hypothetical protein
VQHRRWDKLANRVVSQKGAEECGGISLNLQVCKRAVARHAPVVVGVLAALKYSVPRFSSSYDLCYDGLYRM